ncbi:hypothetical protein [Nocardia carnea]|nr:hypothetical protein [Nocardia carnea]
MCLAAVSASGCSNQVPGSATAAETGGSEPGSAEFRAIAGEWVGSYTCAQGDTGLTLTVEDTGRTEFEFYSVRTNVTPESGRFEMQASLDGDRVEFDQVRWIEQPEGYLMVDLVVTEIEDDTMRGNVDAAGCSTFRVSRDRS